MRVAIAGAGISGAYLYRLLHDQGFTVHLYEQPQKNVCGLTSCAWGSSTEIIKLLEDVGLDGENYVLERFDRLLIDDVRVRGDLLTIDKPKLMGDLLRNADLRFSALPTEDYERVVDATGVARAFLPPVSDDLVLNCCQYLVKSNEPLPARIQLGGIGYSWSLPLGDRRYHVGCGSLFLDPNENLMELGWLVENHLRTLCRCNGRVRLSSPQFSQPFVAGQHGTEVWGIGEAIGCVAPLAGEGIVPGMRCARLLLECWRDAARYRKAVLEEFRWMGEERAIIDQLRFGQNIGLRQARILRRNSRRLGLRVGLSNAVALLQSLGRISPS